MTSHTQRGVVNVLSTATYEAAELHRRVLLRQEVEFSKNRQLAAA